MAWSEERLEYAPAFLYADVATKSSPRCKSSTRKVTGRMPHTQQANRCSLFRHCLVKNQGGEQQVPLSAP
jgi:hypothetical protein